MKMQKNKKEKSIFWQFIKKEAGWLFAVFLILGGFAVARTYSVSFIAKIVGLLESREPVTKVIRMAFWGFLIAALSYILRYLGSLMCSWLTEKLALETRCRLAEHLQKIPYLQFEQLKTGQLQSVLRNDVQQGSDLIYSIFSRILLNVQLFVTTFVYMLTIRPGLAVLVSVLTLLMAFMNQSILVRQKKYQKCSRDAAGEVSESVLSICKGMATIKAYGAQKFAKHLFGEAKEEFNRNAYHVEKIDAGRLTAYNLANYVTLYLSILYFGYQGIHSEAVISDVLVFIVLLRQMMMPAEVVFRWMSTMIAGFAAWDRIHEILEIPEEEMQLEEVLKKEAQPGTTLTEEKWPEGASERISDKTSEKTELPKPQREMSAKQIRFGYEADKPVFDGLNLDFRKGELAVLRGRSGCGKTTLCKVLCGLYKEASMTWKVDDVDGLTGSAENWVTYSPAQAQIFTMSIYENIVFDRKDISRETCMKLADELGIGDWIRSLPQGIDTVLTAGGRTCSGGQRQTLMNMRALLSDKPVLILDEACSALDVEKRRRLMGYLDRIKEEKAIMMITHQEDVAEMCEREIVLQG